MGVILTLHDPASPLYLGGGTTPEVPGLWDVAINGVGYLVDWTEGIHPVSIPQNRQQADQASTFTQARLNPEEFWRVQVESWHRGGGQEFWDRGDADPFRFNSSKGIDPWTRYQLSLLPDTDAKRASVNTNLALAVGNAKLFIADGTEVRYTADVTVDSPTFTDTTIQAGEGAQTVESIASNGNTVWAALGTNNVHQSVNGAAATHYNDLAASLVRWAKGRLMAAATNSLYNITASGAAPAALIAHDDTNFRWQDITGGLGYIFAGGFSGGHSEIWKTAVKTDGTALDVPSPAGELTDGEVLRSLQGYRGLVLIGTDDGIRLATEGEGGNLNIGALLDLGVSVRCFEPEGNFVWFGWTNFDATSTGLGRLDLTQILEDGAPAHASDLMATAQGTVLSATTFQGIRVFAVSGSGFYAEHTTKVASGQLDNGRVSFGIPEEKTLMFVDLRHHDTGLGSVTPAVSLDGGSFASLAGSSSGTGRRVGAWQIKGEYMEPRFTLARSSVDTTLGPTFTRGTFLAEPDASSAYFVDVPLVLSPVYDVHGTKIYRDPEADIEDLITLRNHRTVTTYQRGHVTESCSVWDFDAKVVKQVVDDPAKRRSVGRITLRLKIFD